MISIRDKIKLCSLTKKLRDLKRAYEDDIKKAKNDGESRDDIEQIIAEMRGSCRGTELEIEKIYTKKLIGKARKYSIEIPDKTNEKIWENEFGAYFLTEHGKSFLGKQIKKGQREHYDLIIKIISLLIGLVGALTALATILIK